MQGHYTVHAKQSCWGFDLGAAGSTTLLKTHSVGAPARSRATGNRGSRSERLSTVSLSI